MNSYVPNELGVTEYKGNPIVSSRKIAEIFDKHHEKVIRDIEKTMEKLPPISGGISGFDQTPFISSTYKDSYGRKQPEYLLSRDGFSLVVMGFTGDKALKFKVAYIAGFNQMESFIQSLSAAKLEFPEFTRAIMAAHEEPKHYHYSNEINLINRIVLGMDAKHFKIANGIDEKAPSIRPFL